MTPGRQPETAEEELSRTKEAFRDFVFRAIHDLREPIRAIGANSDLLARKGVDRIDDQAAQCLRHIRDGVDRLESLLSDVAQYSDGEGTCLHLVEISLDHAVREAKRQMSDTLLKYGAVLTHDPLPMVTGDFLALATVFRHLIKNACKFHGPDPPRVHIAAVRKGLEWVLSVRDNGMGFKSEYSETIFLPFRRLHGKQYPGSGLGLALVKRIVRQHGGRIWVESTPGQGSTFRFSLPAGD